MEKRFEFELIYEWENGVRGTTQFSADTLEEATKQFYRVRGRNAMLLEVSVILDRFRVSDL